MTWGCWGTRRTSLPPQTRHYLCRFFLPLTVRGEGLDGLPNWDFAVRVPKNRSSCVYAPFSHPCRLRRAPTPSPKLVSAGDLTNRRPFKTHTHAQAKRVQTTNAERNKLPNGPTWLPSVDTCCGGSGGFRGARGNSKAVRYDRRGVDHLQRRPSQVDEDGLSLS